MSARHDLFFQNLNMEISEIKKFRACRCWKATFQGNPPLCTRAAVLVSLAEVLFFFVTRRKKEGLTLGMLIRSEAQQPTDSVKCQHDHKAKNAGMEGVPTWHAPDPPLSRRSMRRRGARRNAARDETREWS